MSCSHVHHHFVHVLLFLTLSVTNTCCPTHLPTSLLQCSNQAMNHMGNFAFHQKISPTCKQIPISYERPTLWNLCEMHLGSNGLGPVIVKTSSIQENVAMLTGFYPSPKSFCSCTHANSCQYYTFYVSIYTFY